MIRISQEQMARLDEVTFFGRLRRFVSERWRNPRFKEWIVGEAPEYAFWNGLWPQVRDLSEHDCALVLVFLAVCQREGKAAGPAEALIGHLGQHEVGIKQFLVARGYFHFSEFEFSMPAVSGGAG